VNVLVTGGAGFIGSHLATACVEQGWTTTVIDVLTSYYSPEIKQRNLEVLPEQVRVVIDDLATIDLAPLLEGVDVVFHQAGQPGVRGSWARGFDDYAARNVVATQRLMEAATAASVGHVVYASSSSIYGDAQRFPVRETDLPQPVSPYGVTKLAGEHLCLAYAANYGIGVTALRYFTVYGPRQRPDMATHRLIRSALSGDEFSLFGSGEQLRDFTFVEDVVQANVAAALKGPEGGRVFNVSGGSSVSMNELIALVEQECGSPVNLNRAGNQRGDVFRTGGSTERISDELGWSPKVDLRTGVAAQVADMRRSRNF
jgi:nucleoside-diphosphate-sugar epimerase